MKKISLMLIAVIACFVTAQAQTGAQAQVKAGDVIKFNELTHNFGNIQEADGDVSCDFIFTNIGTEPVSIVRATSTCGCTAPTYPKAPIAPGEQGKISVTYHAKGRPGQFTKNVTATVMVGNSTFNQILQIKGVVIPEVKK